MFLYILRIYLRIKKKQSCYNLKPIQLLKVIKNQTCYNVMVEGY